LLCRQELRHCRTGSDVKFSEAIISRPRNCRSFSFWMSSNKSGSQSHTFWLSDRKSPLILLLLNSTCGNWNRKSSSK
jgi:hypothetical protein